MVVSVEETGRRPVLGTDQCWEQKLGTPRSVRDTGLGYKVENLGVRTRQSVAVQREGASRLAKRYYILIRAQM